MMRRWHRLFTEHPRSVDETYKQHFGMAAGFGFRMIGGGIACLVHAVLPFAFTRTGSRTIAQLHGRMSARHSDPAPSATWSPGSAASADVAGEAPAVLRREHGG